MYIYLITITASIIFLPYTAIFACQAEFQAGNKKYMTGCRCRYRTSYCHVAPPCPAQPDMPASLLPASGGNFLDGVAGKSGAVYPKHGGLCLETQGFPDAPNQPNFPSVLLSPTEAYHHDIVYKFSK